MCKSLECIIPKKKELLRASTANYSFVTALGELVDNSLQYVLRKPENEPKKILVILDSVNKTLVLEDNGVGCNDALKMLEFGSKQEQEVYDPSKSFRRYMRGDFSRYGVGTKNACKSLGETYVVSSKTKSAFSKQVVTEVDPDTWDAEQCLMSLAEGEEVESSFCRIEIKNFKFDQFFCKDGVFSSEALSLCLKNLRAMYYLYLEGDNSGARQFVDWLLLHSAETCIKGCQGGGRPSSAVRKYKEQMHTFNSMLKEFVGEENRSSDQIDFEFQVILEGLETPQVHRLSQSNCCIDRMLCKDSKDCFPIYLEVKDEHSDKLSFVTGAVFYFPRNEQETVPNVDELHGQTAQENRRFMTFWMGRWLPGEHFSPEFMKYQKQKKPQAPERCYNRTFGFIFVDRGIEPEANKRALNVNAASLMNMKNAFAAAQLEDSYDLWLKECHLKYDVEVSFQGDEPRYIDREDVSEHNKVTLCGQTFLIGHLVQLSNEVKDKREKSKLYHGEIVRFLQDENFCKNKPSGKVEVDVLQSNNKVKTLTFGIPAYSMKLITGTEYDHVKHQNELKIVRRVIPMLEKERFVAGSNIPFPTIVCQNSNMSNIEKPVLPFMRAFLKGSKQDSVTTFDLKDGLLAWPEAVARAIFTRTDSYVLDLKPAGDDVLVECDSLSFKIIPAAMAEIVLDQVPATLNCVIGKIHSYGLRVLDKYKNAITIRNDSHKLDLVLDPTSARNVEISFKPKFGESVSSSLQLCVEKAKVGTYSAQVVVSSKRNVQLTVSCAVSINVQHGIPWEIQANASMTEFTNHAKFDPIDIAIRDSSANLCHTCPPALLVTSPDLLFSDRDRWERGQVQEGVTQLQPYCTSSLFSCAPAASEINQSVVSNQVIKRWKAKILDQTDPVGVFNEKHGFFQKGDCVMIEREQLLPIGDPRKTCPKLKSYGKITSIFHGDVTGFRVKYFDEVKMSSPRLGEDRRGCPARLLRAGDEPEEELDPKAIAGRCFVFHKSLGGKLDLEAIADHVFFCESDEYPRSLQANLDLFYETEKTLLHTRLTRILKSSGAPRRTKLCRAGGELMYESVASQERQVEIFATHDEEISDLHLRISDEANQNCRGSFDLSSTLQVEMSWSTLKSHRLTFTGNQTCVLPALRVQDNSTHVVSVFAKLDGHETRLCKYNIHVRVKPGLPHMLQLSIPPASLPVTVGKAFQLRGEIVDQHGYSVDSEAFKLSLLGITSFTYRYEEAQDEEDEVEVFACDNACNPRHDQDALSYITMSGSTVVVLNACLLSRPAKGSLYLTLTINGKSDSGSENYNLTSVKLDVEPVAGKPSKVCAQQGQIDPFMSVPSMSQQECVLRFIAADDAGNNVSPSLGKDASMTMKINHKSYKLQKVSGHSSGDYFKLDKLPPLRAGNYNAVVQCKRIQPYSFQLLVTPRTSVTNISMNVQESQKCLEHMQELDVAGAEFLAIVEFITEDQQELEMSQGKKPNVKLFCGQGELKIRYGEFTKNRLQVYFTLFDLGTSQVHAKFTETRASYAAESMDSNMCHVEVRPAENYAGEEFDTEDDDVLVGDATVREPSAEQEQYNSHEDEREKRRKEVQKQISICRSAIATSMQRLPDYAKVSPEILSFYDIPTDMSDLTELQERCEKCLQGSNDFKGRLQSKLKDIEQASEKLQNKSAVSHVKLPGACNALGCLSTLFVIDHVRSSDLQTALSTAFGDELDCVVFHRLVDCDSQLNKICQSSKCNSLNGVALDEPNRSHTAKTLTGVGRASDFVKLEKRHDAATEEKLRKLAKAFFGRLVVFEQFEQASTYCERARPGEMVVGLDFPNRVLFWDGRRRVGSKRCGQPRLGLVDAIHSSTSSELRHQEEEIAAIESELQVSLPPPSATLLTLFAPPQVILSKCMEISQLQVSSPGAGGSGVKVVSTPRRSQAETPQKRAREGEEVKAAGVWWSLSCLADS
eukprot:762616-Hanusia_phi.AAC.7